MINRNHKSQIPKIKQIPITQISNSKRDIAELSPFWSLDIRILNLFACPVGSMRPYQGYLVIGIYLLFGAFLKSGQCSIDKRMKDVKEVKTQNPN